ncbi:glutathione S-transferase T3-like protein [Tanacetum coccineum]
MLFHQFKMQMQMNKQQQSNQFITSQPHSEQQSHHLVDETEEEEEEPLPTPTPKPNRGRKKSVAKRNKGKDVEVEKETKEGRIRHAWTQAEEFLLAESFIQISEDPKTGCDQKLATFWYKILDVYNQEANKKGFQERTKNMLTGKWTPMNAAVMKFNQLYETIVGDEFKHRSAWNFLKDRHKWKNPESTLQRRSRLRSTDKEPDHFRDDELPRPPGLQRIAKSQRSGSNSTASSGSNPVAYQEFMAEQYDLDRKAKMQVLSQESEDRRRLIQAQKIAEDMKVLQIDTSGMDPTYAAIINAQKERIRAEYLPPN